MFTLFEVYIGIMQARDSGSQLCLDHGHIPTHWLNEKNVYDSKHPHQISKYLQCMKTNLHIRSIITLMITCRKYTLHKIMKHPHWQKRHPHKIINRLKCIIELFQSP